MSPHRRDHCIDYNSDLLKDSGVNIMHIKQLASNKCILLKDLIKQVVYAIFDSLKECDKQMCLKCMQVAAVSNLD